jgi:hypothetical protein
LSPVGAKLVVVTPSLLSHNKINEVGRKEKFEVAAAAAAKKD